MLRAEGVAVHPHGTVETRDRRLTRHLRQAGAQLRTHIHPASDHKQDEHDQGNNQEPEQTLHRGDITLIAIRGSRGLGALA